VGPLLQEQEEEGTLDYLLFVILTLT
jgi:hypothetical protein